MIKPKNANEKIIKKLKMNYPGKKESLRLSFPILMTYKKELLKTLTNFMQLVLK